MAQSSPDSKPLRGSLPPKVTGKGRFILRFSVHSILWDIRVAQASKTSPQPQRDGQGDHVTQVRMRWWGAETFEYFYPVVVRRSSPMKGIPLPQNSPEPIDSNRNTLSYTVRCSMLQFIAYLLDMGTLELEVVRNGRPIGYAALKDLGVLLKGPNKSIDGMFDIISNRSTKRDVRIGQLHVGLSVHDLAPSAATNNTFNVPQTVSEAAMTNHTVGTAIENGNILSNSTIGASNGSNGRENAVPQSAAELEGLNQAITVESQKIPTAESSYENALPPDVPAGSITRDPKELLDELEMRTIRLKHDLHQSLSLSSRSNLNALDSSASIENLRKAADAIFANDNDDSFNSSITIPDSDDDDQSAVLDDDFVIEALNSDIGKAILSNDASEKAFIDGIDDISDDGSIDGRLMRTLGIGAKEHTATTSGSLKEIPSDKLALLEKAKSGRAVIDYFQLTSGVEKPDVIWVEYRLPAFDGKSSTEGRIRVKAPVSKRPGLSSTFKANCAINFAVKLDKESPNALVQECISFKVTAITSKPKSRFGKSHIGESSELWRGSATIKCDEVLRSNSGGWQGIISVISVGTPSRLPQPVSKKNTKSGAETPRILGELACSFQFSEDSPVPSKNEASSKGNPKDTKLSNPNKSEHTQQPEEIYSAPHVRPMYFHLHLSTSRALSIIPSSPANAIFVYLVARFFSSSTAPIETPPMRYEPPFDVKTGRLNEPFNFKFQCTLPLAFTDEFIASMKSHSVIAEIVVLEVPDCSSAIWAPAMRSRCKTKILGIVKLPFQQLVDVVVSSKSHLNLPKIEDSVPIMIPDAEYVVLDPFTGTNKGWVTSSMAIGSWKQIESVRKPENQRSPSPIRSVGALKNSPVTSNRNSPKPKLYNASSSSVPNKSPEAIKHAFESVTDKIVTESPMKDFTSTMKVHLAECSISVRIHRVCGVLGLLNRLADSTSKNADAVSHAIEIGANVFVTLNIFPDDEVDESATDNNATITSPIVARTFAPEFDHEVEITVQGLDTDLITWIQKGGAAHGKIWHRIPAEISPTNVSTDVFLGEFYVPLLPLLVRSKGISSEWFDVLPANEKQKSEVVSAVQISACFKTGDDIKQLYTPIEIMGKNDNRDYLRSLRFTVVINEFSIPSKYLSNGFIFFKWTYPQLVNIKSNSDGTVKIQSQKSPAVEVTKIKPDAHSVMTDYRKSVVLKLNPAVLAVFKESSFEVTAIHVVDNVETVIGTAYLDCWSLMNGIVQRMNYEDPNSDAKLVEKSCPLIDSVSRNLSGSRINLRVEMKALRDSKTHLLDTSPSRRKESLKSLSAELENNFSFRNPVEYSPTREAKRFAREKSHNEARPTIFDKKGIKRIHDTIGLNIEIERASHLPLMKDPYADVMVSPFVRHHEVQTVPPNSFALFFWSDDIGNPNIPTHTFRSRVIGAQTSPSWRYQSFVSVKRDRKSLLRLRDAFHFDVHVLHVPLLNVARDSQQGSVVDASTKTEPIGICQISFAPLFSGAEEIYGWQPIVDFDGSVKGQLLIRVSPAENLAASLQNLEIGYMRNTTNLLREVPLNPPLRPPSPAAIAISPPRNARTDPLRCSQASNTSALAAALSASRDASFSSQNVDTWVWTGVKWEHRQVKVEVNNVPDSSTDFQDASFTTNMLRKTPSPIKKPSKPPKLDLKTDNGSVSKKMVLSKSIDELDQLCDMIQSRISQLHLKLSPVKTTGPFSDSPLKEGQGTQFPSPKTFGDTEARSDLSETHVATKSNGSSIPLLPKDLEIEKEVIPSKSSNDDHDMSDGETWELLQSAYDIELEAEKVLGDVQLATAINDDHIEEIKQVENHDSLSVNINLNEASTNSEDEFAELAMRRLIQERSPTAMSFTADPANGPRGSVTAIFVDGVLKETSNPIQSSHTNDSHAVTIDIESSSSRSAASPKIAWKSFDNKNTPNPYFAPSQFSPTNVNDVENQLDNTHNGPKGSKHLGTTLHDKLSGLSKESFERIAEVFRKSANEKN